MSGWIISSSLLLALVMLLRCAFKKHISPRLRYALWLVVLVRLLMPLNLGQSALSVLNLVPYGELSHYVSETAVFTAGEETELNIYEAENHAAGDSANGGEYSPAYGANKAELHLSDVFFAVYALVALGLFVALAFSNLRFGARLGKNRSRTGSFMKLPVYRSAVIDMPCLFGLFSPAIYISHDVDEEQCKYVLMHEYAHYRQKDHVWAWLRGLCLALHWYNPLVWLAARLSKQDGELSCDESVLHMIEDVERLDYGNTLISLSCAGKKPLLCAVTPLSTKGKALKERIEYVTKRPKMLLGPMALLLSAALLVAGCTFTGANDIVREETEESYSQYTAVQSPAPTMDSTPTSVVQLPGGALLDRKGAELTEENFALYGPSVNSFSEQLTQGSAVRLTVDLELQQEAERIINENLAELGDISKDACLILLDVKTGEPLVITTTNPKIDPLKVSFSPYDLFLPCTGIAGLASGIIRPDTQVDCDGVFDRYSAEGIAPQCWLYEYYGLHHPTEILETALRDSCYEYFYAVGNDCGIDEIEHWARLMGLGEASGIELPSSYGLIGREDAFEKLGVVWNIGHTLEAARGRPVTVFTPMQLAQYCATIASNGTRYSASIVSEMSDANGNVVYSRVPTVLSTLDRLSDWGWDAVKDGMFENCNFGANSTSQLVLKMEKELGDWKIAGSHGYAERSNSPSGEGMFMGFAPYDEPRIAVMVVTTGTGEDDTACRIGFELIAAYKNSY